MSRDAWKRWWLALWLPLLLAAATRSFGRTIGIEEPEPAPPLAGSLQPYSAGPDWRFLLLACAASLLAGWRVVRGRAGSWLAVLLAGFLVGLTAHVLAPLAVATFKLASGTLVPESWKGLPDYEVLRLQVFRDECEVSLVGMAWLLLNYVPLALLGGWLAGRADVVSDGSARPRERPA